MTKKGLTEEEKKLIVQLLAEKERRKRENKLLHFKPYPFQKKFYDAGKKYSHRLLMAANRVGKSYSAAFEVAMHLTGIYPDWWDGLRFDRPIIVIAAGVTNEKTRDIVQAALCGDPANPEAFGTGAIPKSRLVNRVRKAGIPNAFSAVVVKHSSGGHSKLVLNAYESGKDTWMGDCADLVWLDEEPPFDIYSQALRAIVDREGKLIMTFTPEHGVTEIVREYLYDRKPHQYLQNATWDDAPHITEKIKQEILASLPPHEREMRSKGIPVLGSGRVYPVQEDKITCKRFDVPDSWLHIAGIDFGFDHATAWVHIAYDPDSDTIYVIDAVKVNRTVMVEVAEVLKAYGADKIPTAWPHDGLKHDPQSGRTIADIYAGYGINMLPERFTNPPAPGKPEGSGGIGVEAGVAFILDKMEAGKFKVFEDLQDWFEEFRLYHRKNGKIVSRNDDLMDATRYAALSLRFAQRLDKKFEAYEPKEADFADPIVAY